MSPRSSQGEMILRRLGAYNSASFSPIYFNSLQRGVDLDKVDFCFGGSTLEMLATKDASDPFIVSRVPGTKCILVAKKKSYTKNLADFGFQFERYVTEGSMMNTKDTSSIEHIHTMKVGTKTVLFRAEVDAVDENGGPVEIKASNPRYWGTKVMLQMISSGSSKLCHGEKFRGTLTRVSLKNLSSVAATAFQGSRAGIVEKNILDGMEAIMSQVQDDMTYRVCFVNGTLKIVPASSRTFVLFPSDGVVKSLIDKE
jgi:hypothetical protein